MPPSWGDFAQPQVWATQDKEQAGKPPEQTGYNCSNTVFFVMMLCFLKETCGKMQFKSWETHSRTHAENLWGLFRAKHLGKMIPDSKKWGMEEDVQSKVHAWGGRREMRGKSSLKTVGLPGKWDLSPRVALYWFLSAILSLIFKW